jgi:hypothetical protein
MNIIKQKNGRNYPTILRPKNLSEDTVGLISLLIYSNEIKY